MENNRHTSLSQLLLRSGLIMATVAALSACSGASKSPNYYTLSSQSTALNTQALRVIEVMPVGLPDRINRSPMALQNAQGQLQILDNERWSSNLDAELRDALSAGLQQKLGAVDRYISGMKTEQGSYRIATDFSRFDIVEQATNKPTTTSSKNAPYQVEVAVAWMIKLDDPRRQSTDKQSTATQLSCRMNFSQNVQSAAIEHMVSSSRVALNQVVDAVAASVLALESGKKVTSKVMVCA